MELLEKRSARHRHPFRSEANSLGWASVRECHLSATLSQPEAVASGAVGALGVSHTLERPLVREPVCDRPPQLHVELGPARPHP
jgi:hypothetical protein